MRKKRYDVSGKVEIFPVQNPWIYVRVPIKYTKMFRSFEDRGLVAITVALGKSRWNTSLMPMGDGTQFIPLSIKVRKNESIKVGDRVLLSFALRTR